MSTWLNLGSLGDRASRLLWLSLNRNKNISIDENSKKSITLLRLRKITSGIYTEII